MARGLGVCGLILLVKETEFLKRWLMHFLEKWGTWDIEKGFGELSPRLGNYYDALSSDDVVNGGLSRNTSEGVREGGNVGQDPQPRSWGLSCRAGATRGPRPAPQPPACPSCLAGARAFVMCWGNPHVTPGALQPGC